MLCIKADIYLKMQFSVVLHCILHYMFFIDRVWIKSNYLIFTVLSTAFIAHFCAYPSFVFCCCCFQCNEQCSIALSCHLLTTDFFLSRLFRVLCKMFPLRNVGIVHNGAANPILNASIYVNQWNKSLKRKNRYSFVGVVVGVNGATVFVAMHSRITTAEWWNPVQLYIEPIH